MFTSQGIARPSTDLHQLAQTMSVLPTRFHEAVYIFLIDELSTKSELLLGVVKRLTQGDVRAVLKEKAIKPFVRIDKIIRDVVVMKTPEKKKASVRRGVKANKGKAED